jgi:LPXTG-motif cell wall-anchored protein
MLVRRAAAVTGVVLGLALLGAPAWADEPTPDPACTTYPVDGTDPGAAEGEATAEPGPVDESPVEGASPSEEPAPEETAEPPVEATEEPPAEPTEEPLPEPTDGGEATYCAVAVDDSGMVVELTEAMPLSGGSGCGAAELPRTGQPSLDLVGLGAGMVLLGVGAVTVGRRRSLRTAP